MPPVAPSNSEDEDKPLFATTVFFRTLSVAVTHPIEYTKVLIQIGHEPIPPYNTKTIFGRPALALPNVFKYMKFIKSKDGYAGLFRGFAPRLWESFAINAVYDHLIRRIRSDKLTSSDDPDQDSEEKDFSASWKELLEELTGRCIAVAICHPLHVVTIRSMAQFVGRESRYSGFCSPLEEIYRENGFLGYFSGVIPRIIGEAFCLATAHMLFYTVNTYLAPGKDARHLIRSVSQFLASTLTYPFVVVSNVMAVSGSGLSAGHPPNMIIYTSWVDCWVQLQNSNQLKRGSSLLWRLYQPQIDFIPQVS